jgi:histidinol phosphatase-like PHP family hydrolase
MRIIKKVKTIASNKYLGYVMKSFAKTSLRHPYLMTRESTKFLSRWLLGRTEQPQEGLRFEQHCHSHFSDGDDLSNVVELLFEKGISVWSLTDHGNSNAFDSIREGSYNLNEQSKAERNYDLDFSDDGRSMVIHSGDQQVILLRSIELRTNNGEIGIHGYTGKFPKNGMTLGDAIKKAKDMGGYVVVNHPYFWEGIGFQGRACVEFAIKNGAVAIEKNGTEIPPQIHSAIRAELDSKHFEVPLVTSGDAHHLYMYGLSGLTFQDNDYKTTLAEHGQNHADAIKQLVTAGDFGTYFNYLTPKEFLGFFSFSDKKEV